MVDIRINHRPYRVIGGWTLAEVRQAYSFGMKEYDLLNQLNFDDGGRVAREQSHEGYYLL